ncbi:MAG: YbfB/YjiJ family MFS transporter [Burkholderiales bacterium]|nr:MAG: YbfB/YjiJ family MFS transporter [Burkholderiales bacterium]
MQPSPEPPATAPPTAAELIRLLAAGVASLAVAMGIGRFAYTLTLPAMQLELGFGPGFAGWLAGANYAGYFVGALAAGYLPRAHSAVGPALAALALSTATTAALAVVAAPWLLFGLRFVSGVVSALIMVLVAEVVFARLAIAGRAHWSGWFIGGVGLGIVITSAMTLAEPGAASSTLWLQFGIVAALLSAGCATVLWAQPSLPVARAAPAPGRADVRARRLLMASYGLEGLGYIVAATFIVAFVSAEQRSGSAAAWTWLLVGAAAMFSGAFWQMLGRRTGAWQSLTWAYVAQTVSVGLLLLAGKSLALALVAAALFGLTFPGIALMTMALAPGLQPENPRRLLGLVTGTFSLGQAIGPVIAGAMAEASGSHAPGLAASAVCIMAGGLLCRMAWPRRSGPD